MHRRRLALPLLLAAALLAPAGGQAQEAPFAGLDSLVERAMQDWGVPGVAIAVVRNDSVIFARGYGVREVGKPEPVDVNTVFAIASITKSFTAAGVGMLVDEGRLTFDDRAHTHLPDLEFADPWMTREFSVRDMLSHRSGLERGDWLWFGTDYDRTEVVRHIRYLRQVGPFRTTYGYSNNMYIAAGQMIAAVTGMSWDEFMHRRIFEPLGMTRTNTSVRFLPEMDNVAKPHERIHGRVQRVPHGNLDNEGPGGSINSTVLDMARYIRFQLGGGTFEGKQLLRPETLAEMHTPQTLIPITQDHRDAYPDLHFLAYGMGWEILDYHGRKVVQHSGSFDGMRARLSLIPEENAGFVILTNLGWGNMLDAALRNVLLDALLGDSGRDWSGEYLARVRRQEAEAVAYEKRIREERVPGTKPSLAAEGYAGSYRDEGFGPATVKVEGGKLVLTLGPRHTGDMVHYHHDTFWCTWRDPRYGWSLVTFSFAHDGSVTGMDVGGVRYYRRVRE